MKTYIVKSGRNQVAVLASNKIEAYTKVLASKGKAQKSNVLISSCHIDYASCEKIY